MRLLVVEDEASVALGVERALVAEGYEVDVAHNGRHGLELALTAQYDLIVLDVMLPGVNGYELCRTARRAGVNSSIIMLTAKCGEWDIAEGLDLGADDYITKPFSTIELLARIRARVRGSVGTKAGAGTVYSYGDLRFDPSAHRCWRGQVEVELTGRETTLLSVLFEDAGRIVPKHELLERAWGTDHDGEANVVEVYIGRLRRKLDGPFGEADLETIRGVGYRLRPRPPAT
jgi:DNA-binding response OmpR family regulator